MQQLIMQLVYCNVHKTAASAINNSKLVTKFLLKITDMEMHADSVTKKSEELTGKEELNSWFINSTGDVCPMYLYSYSICPKKVFLNFYRSGHKQPAFLRIRPEHIV